MKMNRTKIMARCGTQVVCFVLFQTIFENSSFALLMKYGSPTSRLYFDVGRACKTTFNGRKKRRRSGRLLPVRKVDVACCFIPSPRNRSRHAATELQGDVTKPRQTTSSPQEFLAFLPSIIHILSYPFAIIVYATSFHGGRSFFFFCPTARNVKLVYYNTPAAF